MQILIGFTGPYVGLITARGVRMKGRVAGGRLTLGQIDRLLPPPSGEPFRLPDQRVDVEDAGARSGDAGGPGGADAGRARQSVGRLPRPARHPFARACGSATARSPAPVARLAIRVADRRPGRERPGGDAPRGLRRRASSSSGRCSRSAPGWRRALDGWRGATALRADRFAAGSSRLDRLQGRLSFERRRERHARRSADRRRPRRATAVRAARARFAGRYSLSPRRGDLALQGAVAGEGVTAGERALASLAGSLRGDPGHAGRPDRRGLGRRPDPCGARRR